MGDGKEKHTAVSFFFPKKGKLPLHYKKRKLGHGFKMFLSMAVSAQAVSTPWYLIVPGAGIVCMLDMLDIS